MMHRDWSRKSLHRLIVTSATYRQSSFLRDDLRERDPNNRLLARQSRIRLEAEAVRDAALAASGALFEKVGGQSVFPPQPEGLYVVTQTKKSWPENQGPDRFRRGLYIHFWRSSPYPLLPTFDAPDGNTTCTRRARSNTPLQALTLANDRVFAEIAEELARRIVIESPNDPAARIRRAFEICLSREPNAAEEVRLAAFLDVQRSTLRDIRSNAELVAWTAGARVLMNLDEFITRE
jgi:hypothetical protein